MININIEDVKQDFSAFLEQIESGEEIMLVKSGKPLAEIIPVKSMAEAQLRPYGLCAGEFTVPDDFDDPLPEEILREFE